MSDGTSKDADPGLDPARSGSAGGERPDRDEPSPPREPREPREPRPMIERLGLAAVALLLAALFGGVAVASWLGGEPFLAVMAAIGSLMTVWVGALTLIRS